MSFIDRRNQLLLNVLLFLLFLNILLNFITPVFQVYFGLVNTSGVTLIIYSMTLIIFFYMTIRYRLFSIKKIIIYTFIMFIMLFNYVFYENSREYIASENMILIYLFFLPICIFMISSITNWGNILTISSKYSKWAIIISVLILVLNLSDSLNYMEFSYGLLPFMCLLLVDSLENYKFSKVLYLISGSIVLLLFGARSPLLFLICLLVYWVITNLSKTKGLIVSLTITASVFFVLSNIGLIFEYLSKVNIKMNSYILSNLLAGEFFASDSRVFIYDESKEIIKNMGFKMYGLFGDRMLTTGVYSHNIIYEVLISFGWILGMVFLLGLLGTILTAYIVSKKERLIVIAFTFALFARYFISGSFVMEQMFYIYISIMIAFILANKKKRVI